MWNLKNNTNELIYKTGSDLHIEYKLIVIKKKWGEG